MSQQRNLGDPQQVQAIAQSMRSVAASQRATGQQTVPVAWVDSWAAQLDAAYPAYAPVNPYPYRPYQPYRPYTPFFLSPYFHPIDTFVFPFSSRVTVRQSSG